MFEKLIYKIYLFYSYIAIIHTLNENSYQKVYWRNHFKPKKKKWNINYTFNGFYLCRTNRTVFIWKWCFERKLTETATKINKLWIYKPYLKFLSFYLHSKLDFYSFSVYTQFSQYCSFYSFKILIWLFDIAWQKYFPSLLTVLSIGRDHQIIHFVLRIKTVRMLETHSPYMNK